MTSKERVRKAILYQVPDRIPAAFEAVDSVRQKLMNVYGYHEYNELLERYQIDIVEVTPRYIGPPLTQKKNDLGQNTIKSYWGFEETMISTDVDTYPVTSWYPLNNVRTEKDLDHYQYPSADWFDYDSITKQCEENKNKAIIVGHEGPFQIVTYLMEMSRFLILMLDDPGLAKEILNRMVSFELEYYTRIFEAGNGNIDILRPHDDYGTQISTLFSPDMWKDFFEENTKKLTALAHQYGAFYQQHSCGAIRPIIPMLIDCNVDVLEPLQKVEGLEPESLKKEFGGKIAFHGGIDTQSVLPKGTPQQVRQEAERLMHTLGGKGGYILMASQAFEGDVPIENIEAVYSANRYL